MKACRTCGVEQPESAFPVKWWCSDCRRVWQREYRRANAEKANARARAWNAANADLRASRLRAKREADGDAVRAREARYRAANREQANARQRAYRQARREELNAARRAARQRDPERHRAYHRKYRAAHRDEQIARSARYRKENPEYFADATRKRRTLKANVHDEEVLSLVVLERADGICGICGGDVDPQKFDVDHIIPISRGGRHSYANTQPAHPFCNRSKHNRIAA